MRGPWCLVGDGVFVDLRRSDGCVRRCTRLVQELTSPCNSIGGAVLFLQARQRCVQKTTPPVEERTQRRDGLREMKAKHLLSSQTETRAVMSRSLTDKCTNVVWLEMTCLLSLDVCHVHLHESVQLCLALSKGALGAHVPARREA
ncbi:hypothetical protein MHYP_G00083270 [Metynnis hypsauchen]